MNILPRKPGFYWAKVPKTGFTDWQTVELFEDQEGTVVWLLGHDEGWEVCDIDEWGEEIVRNHD